LKKYNFTRNIGVENIFQGQIADLHFEQPNECKWSLQLTNHVAHFSENFRAY